MVMIEGINLYFAVLFLVVAFALTMVALYGVIRLALTHERGAARKERVTDGHVHDAECFDTHLADARARLRND